MYTTEQHHSWKQTPRQKCNTGCDEEMWRLAENPNSSWSSHISEDVDQWKCSTDDTEAKARHCKVAKTANYFTSAFSHIRTFRNKMMKLTVNWQLCVILYGEYNCDIAITRWQDKYHYIHNSRHTAATDNWVQTSNYLIQFLRRSQNWWLHCFLICTLHFLACSLSGKSISAVKVPVNVYSIIFLLCHMISHEDIRNVCH